jgi:excinuclease ABC subunit A
MDKNYIELKNVAVHNLKNIDVRIPKNKLVVICGISGSGKSSLAFDTIFQEGQRRYLESLSSYARQFLGGLKKPDVERIDGLSPTVAVNQKTISSNPRSTVGTLTEIYDYLRLIYAHIGKPHCPKCGKPVVSHTPNKIAENVFQTATEHDVIVLASVIAHKKGQHQGTLEEIYRAGWPKVRIDGIFYSADEAREKILDRQKTHSIDVLIDTYNLRNYANGVDIDKKTMSRSETEALARKRKKLDNFVKEEKEKILLSVKKGLDMGKGRISVYWKEGIKEREMVFSSNFSCPDCQVSLPQIEPKIFSFNNPYGACKTCQGLGKLLKINPELMLNPNLSLNQGAVLPWFNLGRWSQRSLAVPYQKWSLESLAEELKFSLDAPFKGLPEDIKRTVLFGSEKYPNYEGIVPRMERTYHETDSEYLRSEISKYMTEISCPDCRGARLAREPLAVKIAGKNIHELASLPVREEIPFFKQLEGELTERDKNIARPLVREILKRLSFLVEVGVEYIDLAREATTLSVGENQRIRLACQLGSALSGVIYVLDEPTVGLHQRDVERLIKALRQLQALQNTVIVVEHDEQVMKNADWIIEIGPGAGRLGGKVVFEGTYPKILKSGSLTGKYLARKLTIGTGFPKKAIDKETNWLELAGASQFSLKNIDLRIPLEKLVCVGGVSGSGKSTLVIETLSRILQKQFYGAKALPGAYKELKGTEFINKVVLMDQSPIGKTPRSNPATYTGVFNHIRELYSRSRDAQMRGFGPGHFSFNTKQGRCPVCQGEGFQKVEMYFLPDVYVECELCRGQRFTSEVLNVKYKDKSIAEVLDMSIEEAKNFFTEIPMIRDRLQLLFDIGLGYLKLGQSAPSLSGGEAQRIKLAFELSKRDTGRTAYILDEPTVGLHFDDTKKLLMILRRLVEKGNSVIIIEHSPQVLMEGDWVIELGPEGGDRGGKIVFQGTPDQLKAAKTWTSKFLD